MNMLKVPVLASGPEGPTVGLPGGVELRVPVDGASLRPGAEAILGIRPEHIRIAAEGALAGEPMLAERLGSLTILHVDLADGTTMVVQTEGSDATPLHRPVKLALSPADCHLFETGGRALTRNLPRA